MGRFRPASRRKGAGVGAFGVLAAVAPLYFDRTIWFHVAAMAVAFGAMVVFLFSFISDQERPVLRPVKMAVFTILAAVIVGVWAYAFWPLIGLGQLSPSQRERFVAVLKGEPKPLPIHLMCPPGDEVDCSSATQFIDLFLSAGWPVVGKAVQRIEAGQPREGLYFVLYRAGEFDYAKPEIGLWTKSTSAYRTVRRAFGDLLFLNQDILKAGNDRVAYGESFPDNEIGIYFGHGTVEPRK